MAANFAKLPDPPAGRLKPTQLAWYGSSVLARRTISTQH